MTSKPHWTEAFPASSIGLGVFTNRFDHGSELPGAQRSTHFSMGFPGAGGGSGASADTRYADGGYEFEEGGEVFVGRRTGCWIYGWAALRLLCHLKGYEPPRRRMKLEPFRPVPALIVVALAEQLAVDRHTLGGPFGPIRPWASFDPANPYDHLTDQAAAFWRRLERIHVEEGIDV